MEEYSVYSQFDIEKHKKHFVNYFEVVILEDGTVEYAVPSHQEKLISIMQQRFNCSREQVWDMCPIEYYFDVMQWMCKETNTVSVWSMGYIGNPNTKQKEVIQQLIDEKLLKVVKKDVYT